MLLFSKEFLSLKSNFRKINALLNTGIAFILLCFIYSLYSGDFDIYSQPYSLVFCPLIFIGWYVYRKGFKPAKVYSIAWGLSLALVGVYDLNKFGVFSFYSSVPFDSIGHIVESVILSYAISVKVNLIVEDKEQQNKILIRQARLASMGQMLENISHQWRQPLNRSSTYIINMQVYINNEYSDDGYLIKELDQLQLQLEYMSNTINDFTNFNRQSEGKEDFLVSTVIYDVKKILGDTLESNNIIFEIDNLKDFRVTSYKNELAQVVLNLIQNAQDVLQQRQVEAGMIKVVVNGNVISVQDNAGGVEPGMINNIFDPYFSSNNKPGSLGLGLYMSRIILEKYFNAKIEVKHSDQYTSFDILF